MSDWRGLPTVDVYGRGLRAVAAGQLASVLLREPDGRKRALDVHGWCSDALSGDSGVLARCTGPTLDVGCGPGRLGATLVGRGVDVLGIDVSAEAVRVARTRQVTALQASIFDELPDAGRWAHVLLLDGNLGIDGQPQRLLARCRSLLAPGGSILVETDPMTMGVRATMLRLEDGVGHSGWFPWAFVGPDALALLALAAGLRVHEQWTDSGRCFANLVAA